MRINPLRSEFSSRRFGYPQRVDYGQTGPSGGIITVVINPPSPSDEAAELFLEQGFVYVEQGDLAKAFHQFSKVSRGNSAYVGLAHMNMGCIYIKQERFGEALIEFNLAEKLGYRNAALYLNRGLAFWGQGKFGEAIQACNRAIQLDSKFAAAYHQLGLIYHSRGAIFLAETNFEIARELNYYHGLEDAE